MISTALHSADEAEQKGAKKDSAEILRQEVSEGMSALMRPASGLFMSGLSAGLDVGFSLFLMAVMMTQVDGVLPKPVAKILVANMYSVGFIFVVLGRSELFTEQTTLAVLPVLSRKRPLSSLLRLWAIVLVANLTGATIFAKIAVVIGPSLRVIEPSAFGKIARQLTGHSAPVIFASAVLAGWLMGLLSWLVAAGRDTISQIVLVWLITTAIGFAGLHHVILGTVEVMSGVFANQGIEFRDAFKFIGYATLGNAFGGAFFVAVIKFGHARAEGQSESEGSNRN